MISLRFALCLTAIPSCGHAGERSASAGDSTTSHPADSLVATGSGGVEIWFTLARDATGPDSTQCVERGLEIRRGEERVRVPLLYTRMAPALLNDSTMRALLWTNCQPGDAYLIDLRSGQLVRDRRAGKS